MRSESLAREVTLRQQIYTNLSQAAAQMRIEGTRDTPMLTVIDAPIRPLHEEPRQVALRSAFAAVVGAALAAAAGLAVGPILSAAAALGRNLPSTDVPSDYAKGVLWALTLGATLLVWP